MTVKISFRVWLLAATQAVILAPIKGKADSLVVIGWPESLVDLTHPSPEWTTHPILGTLVCPALTRLSLTEKKSAPLLLSSVELDSPKVWRLRLNPGLNWWGNTPVTSNDLSEFIDQSLKKIGKTDFKAWPEAPAFRITTAPRGIDITWSSAPAFGPYVLNNFPFTKPSQSGELICTGRYRIKTTSSGYELVRETSDQNFPQAITISRTRPTEPIPGSLEFTFADNFVNRVDRRQPDTPVTCARPIDLPIFSAIIWNDNLGTPDDATFRKAMTHLTPRGALLRSGAGFLGDLVSGPFPRVHPGYNRSVYVRPFDSDRAVKLLSGMNYSRPDAAGPLNSPSGGTVKLVLQRQTKDPNFLEQVLRDSFSKAGIELSFTNDPNMKTHGVLAGMVVPPPATLIESMDDSPILRDELKRKTKFAELMTQYDQSLSYEKPDFEKMKKIHETLFEIEPFTILMQHRACLVRHAAKSLPTITTRQPDWFADLIQVGKS